MDESNPQEPIDTPVAPKAGKTRPKKTAAAKKQAEEQARKLIEEELKEQDEIKTEAVETQTEDDDEPVMPVAELNPNALTRDILLLSTLCMISGVFIGYLLA